MLIRNDPSLLDELRYAPGLLQGAPPAIQEMLYAAFDILQCTYRDDTGQVTIWATITGTTPGIVQALTNDPRTNSDTGATPQPRASRLQTCKPPL